MSSASSAGGSAGTGESYNSFDKAGVIVKDPQYVLWLQDRPNRKYGTHRLGNLGVREAAEWLYMRVFHIGMIEARNRVEDEQPTVVVETPDGRIEKTAGEGDE